MVSPHFCPNLSHTQQSFESTNTFWQFHSLHHLPLYPRASCSIQQQYLMCVFSWVMQVFNHWLRVCATCYGNSAVCPSVCVSVSCSLMTLLALLSPDQVHVLVPSMPGCLWQQTEGLVSCLCTSWCFQYGSSQLLTLLFSLPVWIRLPVLTDHLVPSFCWVNL